MVESVEVLLSSVKSRRQYCFFISFVDLFCQELEFINRHHSADMFARFLLMQKVHFNLLLFLFVYALKLNRQLDITQLCTDVQSPT